MQWAQYKVVNSKRTLLVTGNWEWYRFLFYIRYEIHMTIPTQERQQQEKLHQARDGKEVKISKEGDSASKTMIQWVLQV